MPSGSVCVWVGGCIAVGVGGCASEVFPGRSPTNSSQLFWNANTTISCKMQNFLTKFYISSSMKIYRFTVHTVVIESTRAKTHMWHAFSSRVPKVFVRIRIYSHVVSTYILYNYLCGSIHMGANWTVWSATMLRKANEIIVEWLKSKDTENGHRFNVNTTGKLAEVATSLPYENSGSSGLDTSQKD